MFIEEWEVTIYGASSSYATRFATLSKAIAWLLGNTSEGDYKIVLKKHQTSSVVMQEVKKYPNLAIALSEMG